MAENCEKIRNMILSSIKSDVICTVVERDDYYACGILFQDSAGLGERWFTLDKNVDQTDYIQKLADDINRSTLSI